MSLLDAKEQVRQAVDIVDLVGNFIQLRRQGRNYVGLCPWHDDRRPSLQVNPERQSFKCWVCDIGGDVFSFLMQIEGVTFPEALEMLAERAGIDLRPFRAPHGASADPSAAAPAASDKVRLLKAAAWAERQYHQCLLHSPEAEPARRYLTERGISAESITRFGLGFSPPARDWLLGRANHVPERARLLEAIGILVHSEGGGWYDRFKSRLLFSIHDVQGRTVGFGGRVLPELAAQTTPAKYVNSPETPLFAKSRLLYGLDLARQAIRKQGEALVMEGYTDVIAAHQYGLENAVAVLGTALGEAHVRLLKRFADRVVLVLDGDEAGQRRTNEVLELFVAQAVDLRILTLPEGLDPCEFLQARGTDALRELLSLEAVDALEHAFRTATRGIDVDRDIHAASEALERLLALVARAPHGAAAPGEATAYRQQRILQRIASHFRVEESEVRRRIAALRRQAHARFLARDEQRAAAAGNEGPSAEPVARIALDSWQRELLELLVAQPALWPQVRTASAAAALAAGPAGALYDTCCRLWDQGELPSFDRLMLEFESPHLKGLLVELDENWQLKEGRPANPESLLKDLLRAFHEKETQQQSRQHMATLREGRLDEREAGSLLENILQQQRNRQGISEPTDG